MPRPRASGGTPLPAAEPLHRHALHLLRAVATEDAATGLSAARLSALSVLVFGGPSTPGALANAERVSAPTMSRLVDGLVAEGWVRRDAVPGDARATRLSATAKARALLLRAREARLTRLSAALQTLGAADRQAIEAALPALGRLTAALASRRPADDSPRVGRRRAP